MRHLTPLFSHQLSASNNPKNQNHLLYEISKKPLTILKSHLFHFIFHLISSISSFKPIDIIHMLGRSRHLHRDPGIGRFSIAKTQSRQSPMWTQWTPPKKLKNMAICFLHPIYGNTCSYFFHAYERACAMKYFICTRIHASTFTYTRNGVTCLVIWLVVWLILG